MPNLITHKIFAEEVLKHIDNRKIRRIIENNLQLYGIGSNGPDPLFFYDATPWNLFHDNFVSQIGNTLHCGYVNDFYIASLKEIDKQTHEYIKRECLLMFLDIYVTGQWIVLHIRIFIIVQVIALV